MQRRTRNSRNLLHSLLSAVTPKSGSVHESKRGQDPKRGHLLLESLESRQLMAGDMDLLFTDGADNPVAPNTVATNTSAQQQTSGSGLQLTTPGEGEAAPDLVQFARDLAQLGVTFYGAEWCPACTSQKERFSDGKDDLPFVEVTNPDRSFNSIAQAESITQIPTWDFPDGTRLVGDQTLETLAQTANIAIPSSDTPTIQEIGDLTVRIGSPLHVPVDAYDPGDGNLVTSVSVGDPSLLEATVLTGNRSLRIDMAGYGDMVFELFDGRAPRAAGRVAELADEGFYDGIIFHRVVDGFVLQAGDPTGTGTSGSTKGTFDDEFHPDLQHNTEGVLSFAKTTDDTNNSQFFITEPATRHLDFNHSVFGTLVEGFDVREAISSTAVNNPTQNRPINNITIESATTFTDNENSVVMLKAIGNQTGSTTVTFTVTDPDGNSFSETVNVTIEQDNANGQPYLDVIAEPVAGIQDQPATLQLSAIDVEGDAVDFFASSTTNDVSVDVDRETGLVTVTPVSGFTGTADINVGVQPGAGVTGNNPQDSDNQRVTFNFEGESVVAPTSVDLQTGSDTGSSNIDNVTNAGSLSFLVSGVVDGQTVELVDTNTGDSLGQQVASASTVVITIDNISASGDATYAVAARSRSGTDISNFSPSIDVVYDSTPPDPVASTAVTSANVNRPYISDLISDEEGSGLTYTLVSSPPGATIDATTGIINWTPTESQTGDQAFGIRQTDLAGNTRDEDFSVSVSGAPLAEIALDVTDLQGNDIDSLAVGEEFLLTFTGVDARLFNQPGVFAAYADILFDNTRVRPVAGVPIQYESLFNGTQKGTITASEIDELGAFASVTSATNQRESLIATVRFEAVGAGTTIIRSEEADESNSDTLLFGNDDTIPAESIAYGSVQLSIGQSFTVSPDTFSVAEDSGATALDVLANDSINSGSGQLSVVSVTQPTTGGTVSFAGGAVSFTPDANFNGDAVFTYRVSDNNGVQENGSVTVTVTPVNDPPTGVEDTITIAQDSGANTLDVLANDSIDPDTGETLTITDVSASTQGATVSVASDGESIVYTPASGFTGADALTYTLSDGTLTSTVTLNVEVVTVDNPPTATDDTFSLDEDAAQASYDVLANDTRDTDNEAFTIVSVGTPSAGGTASVSADGTQLLYAPAADFNGTETVTYTIRDTGGGTDVGTVTFQVAAVNDPPPGGDQTVTSNRGAGEIQVFATSDTTNPDAGETLSISTFDSTTSQGGSVRVDTASGLLFYTPPSDTFSGTDTFNYTTSDGSGLTTSGVITIEVADFTERSIRYQLSSLAGDSFNSIRLVGTNAVGDAVDMAPSTTSAETGIVSFDDLLPGDYRIEVAANPFVQNGEVAQSIPVTSEADDGDVTIQSNLGSLRPEYISIRDFLRSTPRKNLMVVVAPGQESVLLNASNSVDTINSPQVSLDESGQTLTISGTTIDDTDQSETPVQASVSTTSDDRVQARGTAGDLRLFRINVDESAISFSPTTVATSTQTANSPVSATSATSTALPAGSSIPLAGTGEGELVAQAVTRADVFVPTVQPEEAGSSVIDSVETKLVDTSGGSDSVDAAMQQVGDELQVRLATADGLAEADLINADGVDAVLGDG